MSEPDRARGRVGASRAGTWPVAGEPTMGVAGRRRTVPLPSRLDDLAHAVGTQLAAWGQAELAPGRLFPWLPIGFATGVVLYFAAETEPALWAAGLAFAAAFVAAVAARRQGVSVFVAIGIAAVAAGFLAATLRSRAVEAPMLRQPAFGAKLGGFVETREEREKSDRIVLRVQSFELSRSGAAEAPARVRVSVRKGTAPPVGAYVSLSARLSPPLPPLRPGGYDFARDLYFRGIGASGFALGAVRPQAPPVAPGLRLQAAAAVDDIREAIDKRIRVALPGDAGAIASALITGKRDAVTQPVNDAMYVSSLAHVLSISGYHMAVVAGVVFVVLRGGLALVPGLALRRPVKKWAAGVALLAAAFYLVLSGAEVATQRAFAMTAIVLIGVLLDRRALTLRTLAVAALAVMVLTPEAVVHPSFQMSFAATLALVAVYERGLPWIAAGPKSALAARLALWGIREIIALLVASLVAGTATTIFAAYHFHRLAPYGVLANLAAMPVVSAFVMPAGLMALVLLPFGYDGPLWRAMGVGIDWMTAVAQWVAALPGAVGRIPAFGAGPLLIATAGLVLLALLRTPLRCLGAGLLGLAAILAVATPQPDVLVAPAAEAVAVRGPDGRLTVLRTGTLGLAARDWLAADGDARLPEAPEVSRGFVCDPAGCVARLADGSAVAVARTAEAFADDCARAALIVALREPTPGCRALVIDRTMLRSTAALALRRVGDSFEITPARPPGADRPWAPAASVAPASAGAGAVQRGSGAPAPPDATPAAEDVDPD
ncbi:MAG: ComEC/Rec2 family competence protein [Rhodoplanes sp.]|uniref:ComEC/Rec2 family competence protein n=1 Tax=Rhodoplanes sp. TaxID=1968906 RepID=UPI001859D748|nr:ComEC/Rec2 family competence protein [Rhodoplanes sp.]NVO14005.1 ComEC/Rec2 family competence protein [Rhodoplanes sp.]